LLPLLLPLPLPLLLLLFLGCHPFREAGGPAFSLCFCLCLLSLLLSFRRERRALALRKANLKNRGFSPGPFNIHPFIYHDLQLFWSKTAQETLVKPQNHLNHYHPTTSIWHFSYTQSAILNI
jgi:hypothetical protein